MTSRLGTGLVARTLPILLLIMVPGAAIAHGLPDTSTAGTVTIAALLAVVAALLSSLLIANMLRRDVDALGVHARALLRGDRRPAGDVPTLDELGEVGDWLALLGEDATRGRQALARERALSTQVLDGMSQGVVALDGARRIVLINDTARTMLGLSTSPLGELLSDAIRIAELRVHDDLREVEFASPTGARLVARFSRPQAEAGTVLLLEDVTEMRRLESIRRDFVANVSHELRTPVSVIRANAETLLGGAKHDPVMRDRLVDGLHRNSERLALILTDLLDLSRLDAGQYRFELAEVPLAEVGAAAAGAIEVKAKEHDITIHLELDEVVPVRADRKALEQVLVNLIENAVKYTPRGGNVWIGAAAHGEQIRISVSDDGPGIASAHRTRIFERFYRVDAGRSREAGGTGLGLSIVKHLIESMGGQVGVEANEPAGSRFWIDLPRS